MADIRVKRGTRAQLDAAAGASGLAAGEPYLITDENVVAVGTAINTYVDVGPVEVWPTFNVADYGATGGSDESTEFQAAVDACELAGGGTVLFPSGVDWQGGFTIDSNVPILVSGYGATLQPPSAGTAITVNSGNGNTAAGITVEGLSIDGNGVTTPTGVKIINTDRVRLRDVRIDDCLVGIHLQTATTGWVEGTALESVWIDGCTTGFLFDPASGTSFGETSMLDVGFNDCTTGIKINNTANIYRSRLLGVTFWINSSQTGLDIAGDLRGVTGLLAFEALGTPTAATGIWVAATATNLDRTKLQLEFTGAINTKVGSAGPDLVWSEGNNWHLAASGAQPFGWALDGDTWQRGKLDNEWAGGGGISFGPGNAALDVNLYRSAANVLKTDDTLDVVGNLTAGTDPTTGAHVGDRDYNDARYAVGDLADYLLLAGGTMTGDLDMGANDVETSGWVGAGVFGGRVDYSAGGVRIYDHDNNLRFYIEDTGDIELRNNAGTIVAMWNETATEWQFSADVDMQSNTLLNPADPTAGTHVGDRDYNDARYASANTVMLTFSIGGDLETGTGSFRLPITTALTIVNIRAMVATAPTGASLIFDVNKSGTTLFTTQGDRPTIAAAGTDSGNETPAVTACAAGTYLTVDVDQVGSTVAGADATIVIEATVD